MPWNVIISLALVAALVAAIVVIKRKQDAPLRSFVDALEFATATLRDKPDSVHFTGLADGTEEVRFDPDRQQAGYGEYRLAYDDIAVKYKYERTSEFIDLEGEEQAPLGIQFIENHPTEVYLDGTRELEPRKLLEDYNGQIMGLRRSVRKHLKLPLSDRNVG